MVGGEAGTRSPGGSRAKPGLVNACARRKGVFALAVFLLAFVGVGHGQELSYGNLQEENADIRRILRDLQSRISSIEGWRSTSARIRLLFPELTETDVETLLDAERTLAPFQALPVEASYERRLSAAMSIDRVASQGAFNRYFSAPDVEIEVDPGLAAPALEVDQTDPLYPTARLLSSLGPEDANFYFEFDTSRDFDSPNFWRQPALVPQTFPADLTGRAGLGYNLFLSHIRDVSNSTEVKFPFRVTAMALPLEWAKIDFSRLALLAQLVGHGLGEEQMIKELFTFNRQRVLFSHETAKRSPIDTFKAGLGECIHANELTGTMLELNGLRFRTVGGFNPTIRNIYPGAGHASVEVMRSGGAWEYLDPYLDAYSPGTSAEDLRNHPLGKTVIFEVDRTRFKSADLPTKVTLADIFKYRIYSDSAGRLPSATMIQMAGEERQYGRGWKIRDLEPNERLNLEKDLPSRLQIYVRGRYIISKCKVAHDISCGDPAARASPWAETSFVVSPVDLLKGLP